MGILDFLKTGQTRPKPIGWDIEFSPYFKNTDGFKKAFMNAFDKGKSNVIHKKGIEFKKTSLDLDKYATLNIIDILGEGSGSSYGEPYTSFIEVKSKAFTPLRISDIEDWDGVGCRVISAGMMGGVEGAEHELSKEQMYLNVPGISFTPMDYLEKSDQYKIGSKLEIGLSGLILTMEKAEIKTIKLPDNVFEQLKKVAAETGQEVTSNEVTTGTEGRLFQLSKLVKDLSCPPYLAFIGGKILNKETDGDAVIFHVGAIDMEHWKVSLPLYIGANTLGQQFNAGDYITATVWLQGALK